MQTRYRKHLIDSVSACELRPSAACAAAFYPRIGRAARHDAFVEVGVQPATASAKRPTPTQMSALALPRPLFVTALHGWGAL